MEIYPKNKLAQLIVSALRQANISQVVISPGSRNAPLIIGLKNASEIRTFSITDERCAAFFALGIAQQRQEPVALVCTSGSALLNYYPAISESYYNNIPLVVISADRPQHLIDIGDGQTIRQENVFQNHSLKNVNLGKEKIKYEVKAVEEALDISMSKKGPVHINVPFDEPLYETTDEVFPFENLSFNQTTEIATTAYVPELKRFADIWNGSKKKIVLVGSYYPCEALQKQLEFLVKDPSVLVMIENTANLNHQKFINSIDKLIFPFEENEIENFRPDVLLTLGGMIVSKKIKQHLRKFPPKHHWHIDPLRALDTFHCLENHIKVSSTDFFNEFLKFCAHVPSNYQKYWLDKKKFRIENHNRFLAKCAYSDLKVFQQLMAAIPGNCNLQLGNSSVIRYSQLFEIQKTIKVFCNRGTSGIDGSTSTAIGAAVAAKEDTVFITGDISFFYDSNALWNNYIPKSFRVILINNGGGGIFRFIPGPKESEALTYFETPHNLTALQLCDMFGFQYDKANNSNDLEDALGTLFEKSHKPRLLEIFTPRLENDLILKSYFKALKG